jgi:hypothetical protein
MKMLVTFLVVVLCVKAWSDRRVNATVEDFEVTLAFESLVEDHIDDQVLKQWAAMEFAKTWAVPETGSVPLPLAQCPVEVRNLAEHVSGTLSVTLRFAPNGKPVCLVIDDGDAGISIGKSGCFAVANADYLVQRWWRGSPYIAFRYEKVAAGL